MTVQSHVDWKACFVYISQMFQSDLQENPTHLKFWSNVAVCLHSISISHSYLENHAILYAIGYLAVFELNVNVSNMALCTEKPKC